MSERDPRVDPRPGDVLRRKTRTRKVRQVVKQTYLEVSELMETGRGFVEMLPTFPWLSQWRRWAKGAEVITRAEDAAPAAVLRPVVEGR